MDEKRFVHIDGVAYDVEHWARKHPGGEVMLRFLGKDATAAFLAFHQRRSHKTLKAFRVKGERPEAPVPESAHAVERAFAALRDEVEAAGAFTGRRGYFLARGAFIIGLILGSVALLAFAPTFWPLAALAVGLAWQQCGWFAHDLLHHSVFDRRAAGDRYGLLMGGVVLGFSADWWKRKHNTHHALPNVIGTDPDIDVLPLLAFDERQRASASAWIRATFLRLQPLTVLPILAFARLNWVVQSILWTLFAPGVRHRRAELLAHLAHQAWSLGMLALLPTWGERLGFFLVAHLSSGLMTGSVFMVGHNARPMLAEAGEAPGFFALQVLTTQNVRTNVLTGWFFGGLDHQIEHHLFPSLPRHEHAGVAARVREICAQHGLEYVERGFFVGLVDVWRVLFRVARA
jgi:fatty acid desaturase